MDCSKEAAQSVMLLSDIMRYALQHNEEGKVELDQEIQHLRNLLDIHQLRFNHTLCIQLECRDTEQFKYRRIAPLILITFVENALKYGELQDPASPLAIQISLQGNEFHFFIHNKKKSNPQPMLSNGIGLANTRKRLNLQYAPTEYTLDIKDSTYYYTVSLKINL
jgi:LytS/YehU family sensor histidine kinase